MLLEPTTSAQLAADPGKRYLDWQLDDPAGQGVDAVRPIRDEIERRIRGLVSEILGGATR